MAAPPGPALLALALSGCSLTDRLLGEQRGRVVPCEELSLGMTHNETLALLGPPVRETIHEHGRGNVRVLEYTSPSRGGDLPEVEIDAQSGKVVGITCARGFRIEP
jgi:hypothetical protein